MTAAQKNKRNRTMVTAEGLSLPMTVASRGARAGALLLDLTIIFTGLIVLLLLLIWADSAFGSPFTSLSGAGQELLGAALILMLFLLRYAWFGWFELGPRGATPGKRALGIRVAARPSAHGSSTSSGGRLTAEAVLARNLMRDVEVFIPAIFLISGGYQAGLAGAAALVWLGVFMLFPFFNKDGLRAGDLVGGTWVVETGRAKLPVVMSTVEDRSQTYRFGDPELTIYGEHELQVLEQVLRQNRPEAMRQVMVSICRKIGWEAGAGDEREFLESFYAALRAKLERDMRFGMRKKDKFS